MSSKKSNADNVIYHYIQKILMADPSNPDKFARDLIDHLIIDLGIWIDPSIYSEIPVLAPFVIRDSSCRKKNPNTGKDEWGFANAAGYMRDDNSIIKAIPNALTISSPYELFNGLKRGTGYVACHVWRELPIQNTIACQNPKTNSFIPNLVWLPKQIASLTDRDGSYAQQLIEKISYEIYRNRSLSENCHVDVNRIWNMLPCPKIALPAGFDLHKLNYFKSDNKWLKRRKGMLNSEIQEILSVFSGKVAQSKIKSGSYTTTLQQVATTISPKDKQDLIVWLSSNL